MATRQQIVNEARSWKGVRWKHQGRSRMGVDCAGVVAKVAHDLAISMYDCVNYPRRSQGNEFLNHFREHLVEKSPVNHEPKPGDVAVFAEPKFPCHSGVITEKAGKLYVVHAHVNRRMVVEEPLDPHWRSKLVTLFEYPGTED